MNKFFIALYDFFESRRTLLYALLGVLVVAMASAALRLRFSENITGFFPDGERKAAAAFSNLKIKDKIAVMINAGEDAADKTDEMMACADSLAARLNADTLFRRYAEVEATFGRELADGMRSFLQGNLPLLLSEADYARMDTLVTPRGIAQAMEGNYRRLLSPVGGFIDEYIYDDPLGLSFGALGKLQELNIGGNYTLCDDYLFSKDMTTLLVFISPPDQSMINKEKRTGCSVLNKLTLLKFEIHMEELKKKYTPYTESERMSYIREYLSTSETKYQFAKRTGICRRLLILWLEKYHINDKVMNTEQPSLSKASDESLNELEKELAALRAENRKLQRALQEESLRHEACEELINLAESTYHIKVRKNSDAK